MVCRSTYFVQAAPVHMDRQASTAQACRWMSYRSQLVIRRLTQLASRSSDVFFQVLDGGRSGNRQNHFGTLQQPRQSNLQRRCFKIASNFLDGLMRFLRLTEGGPGKEGNAVLLAIVDDEIGFAVGKAVAILYGDDWHNPASALYVLAGHIR